MTAIATVREATGMSREQIQLIKDTIAKDATDEELRHFIAVCERVGLDPFARQIYLVKRWDSRLKRTVATPQVSIDGFRVVAERTGQYRGQTAPQWCGWDGEWVDVWLAEEPPQAARVGVWREGNKEPLYRPALLRSFLQTNKDGSPAAMWRTMPEVMLLKCAEAQALRAAFPNHLSGVYTSDEMGQAQNEESYTPPERAPQLAEVVSLPVAAEAAPDATPPERQTIAEMFGTKLRQQKTRAEMVAWMREVIASEFEESIRKTLWRMFRHQSVALGFDANQLARQAQAHEEEEVARG